MAPNVDDDDAESLLRLDRRQHNNIKDWAVIVTLAINLAGLVWTAAKWSSAIETLQKASATYEVEKDLVRSRLNALESRQNLIEYQVNLNKVYIEGLK